MASAWREKQGKNKIPRWALAVEVPDGYPGRAEAAAPVTAGTGAASSQRPTQQRCAPPRPPLAECEEREAEAAGAAGAARCPEDHHVWTPQAQPHTQHRPLALVLGMPKCGTTSLHEAFRSAGLESVHWALRAGEDLRADRELRQRGVDAGNRLVARLMQRAASEGLPPLALLPEHVDAVAEMNGLYWADQRAGVAEGYFPQMSLLEELILHYPFAHFVLNVRDHRRWARSVDGHNDLRKRLIAADLPGLPRGVGAKDEDLIGWAAGHHERVRALLGHARVRLLVFDLERHGEKQLSTFLGRRVTWGLHNVTR